MKKEIIFAIQLFIAIWGQAICTLVILALAYNQIEANQIPVFY